MFILFNQSTSVSNVYTDIVSMLSTHVKIAPVNVIFVYTNFGFCKCNYNIKLNICFIN